jgi:hypothetical protein
MPPPPRGTEDDALTILLRPIQPLENAMRKLNLKFPNWTVSFGVPLRWMTAGLMVTWLGLRLSAATNLVVAGDDLQAKINAAASGDTLVVQSGTYPGNLSITKPLYLVCSGSGMVVLPNPVTIATPGLVHLSRFEAVQLLTSATNSNLRMVDCQVVGSLGHADGRVTLRRTTIGGTLNLTNSSLEALRLTNIGRINLIGTSATNRPQAVLVQSHHRAVLVAERYQLVTGYLFTQGLQLTDVQSKHIGLKVFSTTDSIVVFPDDGSFTFNWHWLGDRSIPLISSVQLERGSHSFMNSELITSTHKLPQDDTSRYIKPTVFSSRNADLRIDNCMLLSWGLIDPPYARRSGNLNFSGITIIGGRLALNNSYIQMLSNEGGQGSQTIAVIQSKSNPQITFNTSLVYGSSWNPTEGSLIQTNSFRPNLSVGDAVFTPKNVVIASAPPIAVAWTNQWDFQVSLVPNSPLINAGADDPLKRNRDGSRNTIGSTGGPMYNPALATTDLPMAFWLGLMPQRIVKGLVNTVDLDAAAAAGH